MLKGINLGSSPPGYFPGEIAYAISPEQYEKWIKKWPKQDSTASGSIHFILLYFMKNWQTITSGIRIIPFFFSRESGLKKWKTTLILKLMICLTVPIHLQMKYMRLLIVLMGTVILHYRYGKSYGRYITDVSRWTAGYIIGREISPQEVDTTDNRHPSMNSFSGTYLSITEQKQLRYL